MGNGIKPLVADKFIKAALEHMAPLKGSHIYSAMVRDYLEKTDKTDTGYGLGVSRLLGYLISSYKPSGRRILDFGCGSGELTVRMRSLGYEAYGLDAHNGHLELAKMLASENGFPENIFVFNEEKGLPFDDKYFDIITMFSVFEHLSDETLEWLLPELKRVCGGVIYILLPNRLKLSDDHTGLKFIPWMPRWLAAFYVKITGNKYQYFLSKSEPWDVYYRSFGSIASLALRHGFKLSFPSDDVIIPSLETAPPIFRIGKNFKVGNKNIFIGIPLPCKTMVRLGWPKQSFYPYLNIILEPEPRGEK